MQVPIDELKNRLRQALSYMNMKPIDLSKKTGIPKSSISQYMSGHVKPNSERVYLISKELNVSEAWLMGFDVQQERESENKVILKTPICTVTETTMFGKRLRFLRESKNFSMDKLIELYNDKYDAKMNKSTLSRYENGIQEPIYTVVVNLADFFNVSVDYLSGNDKFVYTPETMNEIVILEKYNRLNDIGQEKADTYISDLLENPKYVTEAYQGEYGYASIAADTGKNGRITAPDFDTIIELNKDNQ